MKHESNQQSNLKETNMANYPYAPNTVGALLSNSGAGQTAQGPLYPPVTIMGTQAGPAASTGWNAASPPPPPRGFEVLSARLDNLHGSLCNAVQRLYATNERVFGSVPPIEVKAKENPPPAAVMERLQSQIDDAERILGALHAQLDRLESL